MWIGRAATRYNRDIARRRGALTQAWQGLWADQGPGVTLGSPKLHFPAGRPIDDVVAWFRERHSALTAAEIPVVLILVQGRFRNTRHVHVGRVVAFTGGQVLIDGIVRTELAGRAILQVKWLAWTGTTVSDGSVSLRGDINGVHCSVFGQQVPVQAAWTPPLAPFAVGTP